MDALTNEQALEASLRIDSLSKERVSASLYAALCAAALVGLLLLVFLLLDDGDDILSTRITLWGSTTLGWIGIAAVGLGMATGAWTYITRIVKTTSEIARLRVSASAASSAQP